MTRTIELILYSMFSICSNLFYFFFMGSYTFLTGKPDSSILNFLKIGALFFAFLFTVYSHIQIVEARKAIDKKFPCVRILTIEGKRYHKPYHYRDRGTIVDFSEAIELGYSSCDVCNPPEISFQDSFPTSFVYHYLDSLFLFLLVFLTVLGAVSVDQEVKTDCPLEANRNTET